MNTFKFVVKILTALAAIAGIIYLIATYGDKIVAWAKKMLGSKCCCCQETVEEAAEAVDEAVEETAEEAVEETAEGVAAEETEVVATEADFQN